MHAHCALMAHGQWIAYSRSVHHIRLTLGFSSVRSRKGRLRLQTVRRCSRDSHVKRIRWRALLNEVGRRTTLIASSLALSSVWSKCRIPGLWYLARFCYFHVQYHRRKRSFSPCTHRYSILRRYRISMVCCMYVHVMCPPSSPWLTVYIRTCCSRELQSQFAAERNWSQFHTPRNLLLALVGVSRVQMLPNSVAAVTCMFGCFPCDLEVGEVGELSEILWVCLE